MNFHNFQYNHDLDEGANFWNYVRFCIKIDRDLYYLLSYAGQTSANVSIRKKVNYLQKNQKIFQIYFTSYKILNFPKYDYAEFVVALMSEIVYLSPSFENMKIAYANDLAHFYPKREKKSITKFIKNNSKLKEKKEKNFYYLEKFSKDKKKHQKKFKPFDKTRKTWMNKYSRRISKNLIKKGKFDDVYLSNKKIVGNGYENDW